MQRVLEIFGTVLWILAGVAILWTIFGEGSAEGLFRAINGAVWGAVFIGLSRLMAALQTANRYLARIASTLETAHAKGSVFGDREQANTERPTT